MKEFVRFSRCCWDEYNGLSHDSNISLKRSFGLNLPDERSTAYYLRKEKTVNKQLYRK